MKDQSTGKELHPIQRSPIMQLGLTQKRNSKLAGAGNR